MMGRENHSFIDGEYRFADDQAMLYLMEQNSNDSYYCPNHAFLLLEWISGENKHQIRFMDFVPEGGAGHIGIVVNKEYEGHINEKSISLEILEKQAGRGQSIRDYYFTQYHILENEEKRKSWLIERADAQKLVDKVIRQKNRHRDEVVPKFCSYGAASPIGASSHNCITWCQARLAEINIHIPNATRGCYAVTPDDVIDPGHRKKCVIL